MPDETQATGNDAPAAADTAETQASEASEQVNEAPEATQDNAEVQETKAPEVEATDTAESKLYAGKYKSIEDLEKAYQNAESKLGQTTSEKAELSRILNQAFDSPAPAPAPAATDEVFAEEAPVNQDIEGLKRVTAVQSFVMQHPEADSASMQEVLTKDPLVKQISGHEAKLEYAYLRSQNMARPAAIAEAEKKAAQAAAVKVAEKETAQVESGKKAAPPDEGAELMAQATSGTPDEREAARKALIKKHLVNL